MSAEGKKAEKWKPPVNTTVPVHLPQEIVRGTVKAYIDDDTMDVVLNVQPPLSKGHNYRFRNTVRVTRVKAQPAGEKWVSPDWEAEG